MDSWGVSLYGDPCRECAFIWSTSIEETISLVESLPATYEDLLARAHGGERHPDLTWTVSAYVWHVGDNLRIWAERLAGAAAGSGGIVGGYDNDLLAVARSYEQIPLEASLWSLRRAVGDWRDAVARSPSEGVVLTHPDRGPLTLTDVVHANAHDASHHRWDIERSLAQ